MNNAEIKEVARVIKDREDATAGGCMLLVLTLAMLPFLFYWKAFIFARIWGLLIVPQFDIAPMTVATSLCLTFVFNFVLYRPVKSDPDSTPWNLFLCAIRNGFVLPAITWGLAILIRRAIDSGWIS